MSRFECRKIVKNCQDGDGEYHRFVNRKNSMTVTVNTAISNYVLVLQQIPKFNVIKIGVVFIHPINALRRAKEPLYLTQATV